MARPDMGRFACVRLPSHIGGGKGVEKQGGSTIILVDRHTVARKDGGVDNRRWRRDRASSLQLPGGGRVLPWTPIRLRRLKAEGDHHRRASFVATGALLAGGHRGSRSLAETWGDGDCRTR